MTVGGFGSASSPIIISDDERDGGMRLNHMSSGRHEPGMGRVGRDTSAEISSEVPMLGQKRKFDEALPELQYPPSVKKLNPMAPPNTVGQVSVNESKTARKKRLRQERQASLAESRMHGKLTLQAYPMDMSEQDARFLPLDPPLASPVTDWHPLAHEELAFVMANSMSHFPPPHPTALSDNFSHTRNDMTIAQPSQKKFIGMLHDPAQPSTHGVFPNVNQDLPPPDPDRTLVMELLPKKFRTFQFVQKWAARFGKPAPARVELDSKAGKCLIQFSDIQFAENAFASPRLPSGEGKEHIRVWWYHGPIHFGNGPTREVEEGEIEEESIREKSIALNAAKGKRPMKSQAPYATSYHPSTHSPALPTIGITHSHPHLSISIHSGRSIPSTDYGLDEISGHPTVHPSTPSMDDWHSGLLSRLPLAARFSSPTDIAWNYNDDMDIPGGSRPDHQVYPYGHWRESWKEGSMDLETDEDMEHQRMPYVENRSIASSRSPSPVFNEAGHFPRYKAKTAVSASSSRQDLGRSPIPDRGRMVHKLPQKVKQKAVSTISRVNTKPPAHFASSTSPKQVASALPGRPFSSVTSVPPTSHPRSPPRLPSPKRPAPIARKVSATPLAPPASLPPKPSWVIPPNSLSRPAKDREVSTKDTFNAGAMSSASGLSDASSSRQAEVLTSSEPAARLSLLARTKELEERIARTREELARKAAESKNSAASSSEAPVSASHSVRASSADDAPSTDQDVKETTVVVSISDVGISSPSPSELSESSTKRASSEKSTSTLVSDASITSNPQVSVMNESVAHTAVSLKVSTTTTSDTTDFDELAVSFITESIQNAKPPPLKVISSTETPPKISPSMEKLKLAAKQRRLEQHIAQTKVLMAKLETARTKDEKSKIFAELRECRRAMDEDMKMESSVQVTNTSGVTAGTMQVVQTFRTRWPETARDAGVLIISDDEDDDDD